MASKLNVDNAVLKRLAYKSGKKEMGTRKPLEYLLIVCEGTRTEPNYFEEIRKLLPRHILELEIKGTAKNTLTLVDEAIELRAKAQRERNRHFDQVWVVFDKDSFPDVNFNNAIAKAQSQKIDCSWSNEAFELWYILHFQYRNTAMSRDEYKGCLSEELTNKMGEPYVYQKNATNMYQLLQLHGDESKAIERAQKLEMLYTDTQFAKHNPCTLVYRLILKINDLKSKR